MPDMDMEDWVDDLIEDHNKNPSPKSRLMRILNADALSDPEARHEALTELAPDLLDEENRFEFLDALNVRTNDIITGFAFNNSTFSFTNDRGEALISFQLGSFEIGPEQVTVTQHVDGEFNRLTGRDNVNKNLGGTAAADSHLPDDWKPTASYGKSVIGR